MQNAFVHHNGSNQENVRPFLVQTGHPEAKMCSQLGWSEASEPIECTDDAVAHIPLGVAILADFAFVASIGWPPLHPRRHAPFRI